MESKQNIQFDTISIDDIIFQRSILDADYHQFPIKDKNTLAKKNYLKLLFWWTW